MSGEEREDVRGRVKILLDTDIGSDIDDAVCLAYLLAQPACELVGITTVSGRAVERARLASALCRVAGREIPIRPGRERPLQIGQKQTECPQAEALCRWPHRRGFPRADAVEFMSATIRRHPHEIVLLTIGPMTNAAALFTDDPDAADLLRGLVSMGGSFGLADLGPARRGKAEWNVCCDPHAAALCYASGVPRHRSIGLDVTVRCTMSAGEVRERFTHDLLRPVLDFAGVWFRERDSITFHDPLAAAVIFDGDLCRFERGVVEVNVQEGEAMGRTAFRACASGPHEVACDVAPGRFFEHYFGLFQG